MPLLNYSTRIKAEKTVGEIQALLVKGGARAVATEYEDAKPSALRFGIDTPYGARSYRLPIDAAAVEKVLTRDGVVHQLRTAVTPADVAWRILKDWIEAQVAILQTEMVTLDQVMLPYMEAEDGKTMYELVVSRGLALPEAAS